MNSNQLVIAYTFLSFQGDFDPERHEHAIFSNRDDAIAYSKKIGGKVLTDWSPYRPTLWQVPESVPNLPNYMPYMVSVRPSYRPAV